jgi:ATP-binding cassette subfamily B protein
LARRFKTEMSMVKLNAILSLIWQYIDYFAQIGVILFGGYMAVKGQITVGTFFLFYTYLSMMIYRSSICRSFSFLGSKPL